MQKAITFHLYYLLFSCFFTPSVFCQKEYEIHRRAEKTKDFPTKDVDVAPISPAKRTERLSEWLKSPYLNVPVEKANVGEITFAFEAWKKAHPEKMNPNNRHKDDEIIKFHRQLNRLQMENDYNETPISVHEKLDAFVKYGKKDPQTLTNNFNNPDANWRLLGPNTQPLFQEIYEINQPTNKSTDLSGLGRINCIEFSNWDAKNIWVGTSTGGVWKTWNGGQTWICITDNLPIAEISEIAIDQSNSNIVYIATGDRDGAGGWYGNGRGSRLYKTTDGGNTWNLITANLGTGTFIEGLWVHPQRPWELVVAKTSGIYKSVDGGTTFTQTLSTPLASPFSAPNNIEFREVAYANLANPERLYTLYFKILNPADFSGSYELRKSDDFGKTWQAADSVKAIINDAHFLTNELKLSIAPSDANCLYIAATEFDTTFGADRFGAIMRTFDGGKTWETTSRYPSVPNIMGWILGDSSDVGSQSFYDFVVAIDPKDKNKIFVSGVDMWGSLDGGKSFNKATFWVNSMGQSVHADHHWGEYQPISGDYFVGTDGGLYRSKNLAPGSNAAMLNCLNGINDFVTLVTNVFTPGCYTFPTKWDFVGHGIATSDVYAIAVSKSDPSIVMAGLQDNSTIRRKEGKWYGVGGPWDGFVPLIHPTNPDIFYTSVQFGQSWRTNDGGKSYKEIAVAMDTADRGEWFTPFEMNEASPNIIYQARPLNLWKSTNSGDAWQKISNFPSGQFNSPSALALSQSNANTIYVARYTQNRGAARVYYLHKTTDGGTTWSNVWNAAFPPSPIKDIAVHPTNPNKIWVCFQISYVATNVNQSKKVFYSEDGGTTWTNISTGLPPVPAWTIAVQGNSPVGAVYVGTGFGIYYKDNTMAQFVPFQRGMPLGIPVVDLKIHEGAGKIFAGTYGRGIWSANLYDQPYDGGINALKSNRSLLLNVYPNPAKDAVRIEWDDNNVESQSMNIVDVFGRVVFSKTDFVGKTTFDMSGKAAGVYTVQLKTDKEVVTKKFLLVN